MTVTHRPLIIEIGTEELPVQEQHLAYTYLMNVLGAYFGKLGIHPDSFQVWITPRRLVINCPEFPDQEPSRIEKIKGPPAGIAYDGEGNPTKALQGFLKSQKLTLKDVRLEETPKGPYIVAEKKHEGRRMEEVLPDFLTETFSKIPFTKKMRWPGSDVPFSRPIRWILALHGQRLIPWQFAGVNAGFTTRIRQTGARMTTLSVEDAAHYPSLLKEAGIIVSQDERMKKFQECIQQALENLKEIVQGPCRIPEDPELMDFWVALTEHPAVLWGRFDPAFLSIPAPILITTMRHHQKYFPVLDEEGMLRSFFITPLQSEPLNTRLIREGHERVLAARIRDAAFFWDEDRKAGIEHYASLLDRVQWLDNGGTYQDKAWRLSQEPFLEELKEKAITPTWELPEDLWKTATRLFKADIVSLIVGEFPELEGIYGALLAENRFDPKLVQAIKDAAGLQKPTDKVPEEVLSQALIFYDRMDSLLLSLGLGHRPSGSTDPLGQRRWTLAMLRVLIEGKVFVHLDEFVPIVYQWLRKNLPHIAPWKDIEPQFWDLVTNRLISYWSAKGHSMEYIRSFLSLRPFNPYDFELRLKALAQADPKETYRMGLVNKRLFQMTKEIPMEVEPDPDLFTEPMERELYNAVQNLQQTVDRSIRLRDYAAIIKAYASLSPILHNYFESVFVMTDDEKLRHNRLYTLTAARRLFDRFGDLSQWCIEVEETY